MNDPMINPNSSIRDNLNALFADENALTPEERAFLKAKRKKQPQQTQLMPVKSIPRDSMQPMQPMQPIDDGYR